MKIIYIAIFQNKINNNIPMNAILNIKIKIIINKIIYKVKLVQMIKIYKLD